MPRPFAVGGAVFFCVLALLFDRDSTFAAILFGVFCAIFAVTMAVPSARKYAVLPCACMFAASACVIFIAQTECRYKPALALAGTCDDIEARIVDLPDTGGNRAYYTIETLSVSGKPERLKIRLSADKSLEAQPYDRLSFKGNVYALGGDGDARLTFKSQGIYLGAIPYGDVTVTPAGQIPPFGYVLKLRAGIKASLTGLLPGENGALLIGMLLGDTGGISPDTLADFRETGLSHLLAVSGLHMSIWAFSVYDFLRRFRSSLHIPYRLIPVLTAAFAVLVMALTGFSPSCMRSGIMMLFLLAGKLAGRRADPLNSLGLSLVVITVFNPFEAGAVSLWLSSLATLGLVLLRGRLYGIFSSPLRNIRFRAVSVPLHALARVFSINAAATLFVLPLSVLCFGRVSLISPIANLADVAVSSYAMVIAGMASIAKLIPYCSFIANPLALFAGGASNYVLFTVRLLAGVPYASVSAEDSYISLWLGFSFIVFALALLAVIRGYRPRAAVRAASALCAAVFLLGAVCYVVTGGDGTRVCVCDVGNGTAVVVSQKGKTAVIGCGGDYYTASIISKKLEAFGKGCPELIFVPRAADTESSAYTAVLSGSGASRLILTHSDLKLEYVAAKGSVPAVISAEGSAEIWDGAELKYICKDNIYSAYTTFEGVDILFIFYPGTDVSLLPPEWLDADILICRRDVPDALKDRGFAFTAISSDGDYGFVAASKTHAACAATCGRGDILFRIYDGKFSVERTN